MRCSFTNKDAAGFTLIEVLIIAPIVIFAISGFVALMVTMVGDSLAARDQNNLSYDTQDALNRIEADTRLTTQFLATSGTLPSPQGSDNNFTGTAAFSSSNTLIMGGLTTTTNPVNTSRQLVFYANQPNNCGSLESYNRPFQEKIMYFIYNGSLWRRVAVPAYNTNSTVNDSTVCEVPWQRNTCSPGYTATNCVTEDTEVMKNITSLSVKYLSDAGSDTDLGAANALSANAIEVTINASKTIRGRTITTSGSIRDTKLNNIDVDLPLPSTPTVTASPSGSSVVFNWQTVPNATSYLVQYNINGGAWQSATTDNRTTTFTVSAYRNDTVSIQVTAKNSTGTSPTYGSAAATIPAWYDCGLQGGWANYNNTYAVQGYTKTNSEVVHMKGVIAGGPTASGTVLCTLPVGYRPTSNLMFLTSSALTGQEGTQARVDVLQNGNVVLNYGANTAWIDLDMIRFVSSSATYTWNTLPTSGGWVNYQSSYAPMQSVVDNVGRVHVQGVLKSGVNTDGTVAAQLPAGQAPSLFMNPPAAASTATFNQFGVTNGGGIVARGSDGATYWSIMGAFYPASFNGWTTPAPLGGWVTFGSTTPPLSYAKSADGVVSLRGLLKNGTTTAGTVIATLPAGYRPAERQIYTVNTTGSWGRIDVLPTGDIQIRKATTGYLSLDSITFIAEQ